MKVYNFQTVTGNYFAAGVLVHNCDLHAIHRWLVLSDDAAAFQKRMKTDPDYFDAKVAGRWVWGLCCWIGSGWCDASQLERHQNAKPDLTGPFSSGEGQHIHANGKGGPPGGSGERSVLLGGGEGQLGHGVHAKGELPQKRPRAPRGNGQYDDPHGGTMPGVHGRPQLADARSRGRGVHNDNHLHQKMPRLSNGDGSPGLPGVHQIAGQGTCAERRAWLLDWFSRLRDRLRTVRVCCGNWLRVCDSESVTTRLGVTGLFLDPPYGHGAGRDKDIYSVDSLDVAAEVRQYCLERGPDPRMRICLAGYAGEGHEVLEENGWEVVAWKAAGGYGNRSQKGKDNAAKERLWFSPACLKTDLPLFGV